MEQIVRVTEDPDHQIHDASSIVLTYTDATERWTAYNLPDDADMEFTYLYRADTLAGAITGVKSLVAATGPTGALELIEEPAP